MAKVISSPELTAQEELEMPMSISRRLLEDALGRVLVPLHRLDKLSLAKLGLETLIGLDEYCPNVVDLDLSRNNLEFLYGLPTRCLMQLNLRRNAVSTLTSFGGLDMVRELDLSFNKDLTDVEALSRLPRLQTLDLSGCDGIRDLKPLLHISNLTRLKFVGKARIKHLVISEKWEWVTVVGCHVSTVVWPPSDRFSLVGLILDDNSLESFALAPSCIYHGLRTLSLAKNRLTRAPDCDRMPQLRHLDLSDNAIADVSGLRVSKRDVVSDVEPAGWRGPMLLQRLLLAGNKLQDLQSIMKVIKRLLRLECIDFRNNPLTIRFYPVATMQDWIEADDAFRKAMTDGEYVRRALYRAVLIRALKPDAVCSLQGLQLLDGVPVTAKERQKSQKVLSKLRGF
jgi:Leucine-rich repeat (LRR) protein